MLIRYHRTHYVGNPVRLLYFLPRQRTMAYTFTERLLLLAADWADLQPLIHSVARGQAALSGKPGWRKNRQWLETVFRHRRSRHRFYATLYALRRRGYLRQIGTERQRGYLLTPKGEQRVLTIQFRHCQRPRLTKGRWLMVFFDIPEPLRRQRDMLRQALRWLDFSPLQKSIWVTRYDVKVTVQRLIQERQLQQYVKMLIVEELSP